MLLLAFMALRKRNKEISHFFKLNTRIAFSRVLWWLNNKQIWNLGWLQVGVESDLRQKHKRTAGAADEGCARVSIRMGCVWQGNSPTKEW
jgi:hypothetical protein